MLHFSHQIQVDEPIYRGNILVQAGRLRRPKVLIQSVVRNLLKQQVKRDRTAKVEQVHVLQARER